MFRYGSEDLARPRLDLVGELVALIARHERIGLGPAALKYDRFRHEPWGAAAMLQVIEDLRRAASSAEEAAHLEAIRQAFCASHRDRWDRRCMSRDYVETI